MEYSVEEFVSFCDQMQIANESILTDVKIFLGSAMKNIIQKIRKLMKNISMNLSKYKHSKVPKQMNHDLESVLKDAQPRTEINFNIIDMYYDKVAKKKKDKVDGGNFGIRGISTMNPMTRGTSLGDQMVKSTADITDRMKIAKNSIAYKRLKKNEYDKSQMELVPLNSISEDLDETEKTLNEFEHKLVKLDEADKALKDSGSGGGELRKKMEVFCNSVVRYCKFRINLLLEYFLHLVGPLSKKEKGESVTKLDTMTTKNDTNFKRTLPKVIRPSREEFKKAAEAYKMCKEAETYTDYKKSYETLISVLKCGRCIIQSLTFEHVSGTITGIFVSDNPDKLKVLKSQELFHVSDTEGLTKLDGRWKTKLNCLYPTPRIYFHLTFPVNRNGNDFGANKSDKIVYRVVNNPRIVYTDSELGRTAVYVQTEGSIEVEQVDYNEWKMNKEKSLGMTNEEE